MSNFILRICLLPAIHFFKHGRGLDPHRRQQLLSRQLYQGSISLFGKVLGACSPNKDPHKDVIIGSPAVKLVGTPRTSKNSALLVVWDEVTRAIEQARHIAAPESKGNCGCTDISDFPQLRRKSWSHALNQSRGYIRGGGKNNRISPNGRFTLYKNFVIINCGANRENAPVQTHSARIEF